MANAAQANKEQAVNTKKDQKEQRKRNKMERKTKHKKKKVKKKKNVESRKQQSANWKAIQIKLRGCAASLFKRVCECVRVCVCVCLRICGCGVRFCGLYNL